MFKYQHIRGLLTAVVAISLEALSPSTARAEDRAVSATETLVRSAPFDVAPAIARLQAGDRLHADDQPQGPWRRVALPDGRYGFVRDADTQRASGPNGAPPSAGNVTVIPLSRQASSALLQRQESSKPEAGPHLLGVIFELLPVGTLMAKPADGVSASADTAFAVGVAPFFDAAVSPYFALGISPQVIFRVKSDRDAGESAKELDCRARLTARLPLSQKVRVFARFSPAYSLILLPPASAGTSTAGSSNSQGFAMGFAVGAEVAVLPDLFIVSNLGYQAGFQSRSDNDLRTDYLHVGVGFAIGL